MTEESAQQTLLRKQTVLLYDQMLKLAETINDPELLALLSGFCEELIKQLEVAKSGVKP